MRIVVSGATGLIGSALVPMLSAQGHGVSRLVRAEPAPGSGDARWDPARGTIDAAALAGVDAAVHLAGENVAGRWTKEKKREIHESRARGTRLLAETLARLQPRPQALVCASAVGYYGDRGEETLRESSAPGDDFLARVCRDWEAAADPARAAGLRVVHLRFGVVLSSKGGALAKMLPPFRMGMGGRVGSGEQWVSWVAIDDAAAAIRHALETSSVSGPVNVVAPGPVRNADFVAALGRVLHRPAAMPMPAFAAKLAFGEMAEALLLASQKAEPERLRASAFAWRFPEVEPALRQAVEGGA